MPTYTFQNPEGSNVLRVADDGTLCAMAWSIDPVQPLDVDGVWGRQWVEDGSPVPGAYVEPSPAPPAPPPPEDVVLYDHENRIRTLEGQPPLSLQDFLKIAKLG